MKLWVLKRQAIGLSIIGVIIIVLLGSGVIFYLSRNSCADNMQNGDEEGVDCGGSCGTQCFSEMIQQPILLWSRYFIVRNGVYDVAAYVENINLQAGSRDVSYTFKLYDKDGVLLEKRAGNTYLLPNQKTLIFEPQMLTGSRYPASVDFDIIINKWERMDEKYPLEIEVASKIFNKDPYPIVNVSLFNRSLFEERAIEAIVILENDKSNAYAISSTVAENITGQSKKEISFTWPDSVLEEPYNIKVIYRRRIE